MSTTTSAKRIFENCLFLLIGSPSTHILSEFMNILSCGALQIIVIKNCLISEDAICEWERMRIRRKQVFLSRMRMTDFRLEAEKKMSQMLQQMSQKVVRFAVPFKSLLTPASTTSSSVSECE